MFKLKIIDENTLRVTGKISGVVYRKTVNNINCWDYDISFDSDCGLKRVTTGVLSTDIQSLRDIKSNITESYNTFKLSK